MEMNGWKKYTMIAGAVAVTLGIMASWQSMDFLPRWAWNSEVVAIEAHLIESQQDMQEKLVQTITALEQKVASNSAIILNNEWFRVSAQLKQKRAELAQNPRDRQLIEEVTRLESQLRRVEHELDNQ